MQEFIVKHQDKISSVLSCFDRLILKGYLPLSDPGSMERFMTSHGLLLKQYKPFVRWCSETIVQHAKDLALKAGRPFVYLQEKTRKEALARDIAEKDGIGSGLVCIFSTIEACRSFKLKYGKGRPCITVSRPRCLCLYSYVIDPKFGFMHIRVQTWFPFVIQVYINGHEWLARQMDRRDLGYERIDNAFVGLEDADRAQSLADRFLDIDFPEVLSRLAGRVNPMMRSILHGLSYYWVIDQAEFATDVLFKDRPSLQGLYESLLRHVSLDFSPQDIMGFLGRKLNGNFQGEVVTLLGKREQGWRIKHEIKGNRMKMYDKHGCILRIETVINQPRDFRVRRRSRRGSRRSLAWRPMAKGVANLFHYRRVCLRANQAYLNALAVVDDPSKVYPHIHRICEPVIMDGRRRRGLNPLRRCELLLIAAALRGEHYIRGFRSSDLARHLGISFPADPAERKRQSSRMSRLLQLLRAHGLIAKIPRTRRYRITQKGSAFMSAIVHLYKKELPGMMLSMAA